MDGGPDRADGRAAPQGPGAPAPGNKPNPPAAPPRPGAPASPDDDLARAIDQARADIDRQRNIPIDRLPEVNADQADAFVQRLRKMREERGRVVGEENRNAADNLRRRTEAFAAQWGNLEEALRNNRKPADIDAKDWPPMRDRYFREKSELQADQLDLRRRLDAPAAELREIDRKIEQAAAWAKRLRDMGASSREVARRLHEARIALMERRLTELHQLKDERERGIVRSNHPAAADAAPASGDWYIDTMNWLARQMELSGRSIPTHEELDKGAPAQPWLDRDAPLRASDHVRGKLKWIETNIARFERELAAAENTILTADEQALQDRAEQLSVIDRTYDPQLSDPQRAAKRQEALDRLRKEQEATRPDRLARERARIQRELDTWREHHKTETASLAMAQREEADRAAAATRPAATRPATSTP